ncbi:RNA polymerase sigma factor [Paremcibacter congregatus]|uniref:RNA polymerase subunit sigma n=1 Tax=Paremcibacter congregatus TaxID=2043170 RepID=A0A2G4YVQ6_9PROT|nr:sigma-70 family RNA polymerase sigma factor [Paremcibacter congregatus]PHZ86407.1 RNA polymerase subunit sigma [Paremcibacter congregatus]QDE28498.1 sigma-70 family RNA polymerase sigma factor [Paremcibacter congregatus]|tara:strand:- start:4797 stop:5375 length:579 start_codon:yes stop_codon:yes gene_type:complete
MVFGPKNDVNAPRAREETDDDPAASTHCRDEIERLFLQHNDSLIRFLVLKLGSRHEARDVAQEAYVKILGLDQDEVVNHLRAYLFKTASNLAINRIRQRIRRGESKNIDVTKIDPPDEKALADDIVDARKRIRKLELIIEELPPKCRMAFLLHKVECRDYADIARQMNLSESMIRKYVLQAIRYCKDRMNNG